MGDPRDQLQASLAEHYVLERELGRGGMATVYLARDLKHARPVALKVLHPDLAATLGPERFLREVRLAASLQHPHILSVHDSGEAAGQLWYTMPYVEGESLRDRLRREKQLPLEDALQLARNVLAALAYAHSHGVIHRDIKPENILLETGEAVVADFGIARAISSAGAEHLTQTGMAIGTPAYMSPEQAVGGSELDGRSDLYSVGCVLYEMLAGEPPYTGPTPQAILAKRVLEPLPHLRTVRESVPEAVERAVTKALAKVPADRFVTASQFAEALAQVVTPAAPIPARVTAAASRRRLRPHRVVMLGTTGFVLLLIGGLLVRGLAHRRHSAGGGPKMLAVLPFENLGRSEDEYFADGLTEELTSRLASLHGLGVISRTSAMQYKKATKPLKQIGRELAVGYVLEGSVRWEKSPDGRTRIRVTPQLIDVADDRHLWTERYDAELADVFQVQGQIAEQVTSALDVALGGPERQALAAKPTQNPEAYTHYLRATEYWRQAESAQDDQIAVELYEKAVAVDPRFALAYAKLSEIQSAMYYYYVDRTDQRLARAKAAAETALRLQPDLPEAHLALGYCYYYGSLDDDRALQEFAIARDRQPNNSDLLQAIGLVQRRQGKWTEALAKLKRAAELDPRSSEKSANVAFTSLLMRRYPEALQYYDRNLALSPQWAGYYALKAFTHLRWRGDTAQARAAVREALTKVKLGDLVAALFSSSPGYEFFVVLADIAPGTLAGLPLAAFDGDTGSFFNFKEQLFRLQHQPALARLYTDSSLRFFEAKARARPADPWFHMALALLYGDEGRRTEATREGGLAVKLLPTAKDAYDGPWYLLYVAEVYAKLREPNAAIDRLEYLLSIPSAVSIPLLRVDPVWDPLRGNPRFERLLATKP